MADFPTCDGAMEGAYSQVEGEIMEHFGRTLHYVLLSFKQEEHISLLRKLLLYITELPQTSSRFLINNLVSDLTHQ